VAARPIRLNPGSSPNNTAARAVSAPAKATGTSSASHQLSASSSAGASAAAIARISVFAQKPICDHTVHTLAQLPGPMRTTPTTLVVRPANTAATTPEAPSALSAIR
jgi:hypothetical protein